MNVAIRRVVLAVVVMVVVLLANATYVQVFKADSLRANPLNSRVLLDEYSRQRGNITAGNEIIASSIPTDDRLKFLRTYPTRYAPAFAPVTGFYSYQYSRAALEQAEDSLLNGSDDRLFGQRFRDMFSGRDPRGGNVVTTIDPKLQKIAWNEMNRGCNGGCRGAVVALDPTTGAIKAMVSTPSYDPNQLSSHDSAGVTKAWERFNANQSEPMLNRALNSTYPPGSTFKVLDVAAALSQGLSPDTTLTGARSIVLPQSETSLSNYNGEQCPGGQTVSMTQAFRYSCNTAFVDLTTSKMRNPIGTVTDTANKFGIDASTDGVPMTVSESTVGDIANLAQLGQSSIGQFNVRFTPLQNAIIAATVANGGVRMRPYLVDKLQSSDLRTLLTAKPSAVNEPISPEVAAQITTMMQASEKATTGATGADIASKTGTAEHATGRTVDQTPFAWYIAFGPSKDAKLAVAVIVENGDAGLQATGGSSAAPIGRALINAATGDGQ